MKKFATYLGVGIIPCAIVFLLFFTGLIDSCSDRKTTTALNQIEVNEAKRHVADSITTELTNRRLESLDSLAKKDGKKIASLTRYARDLESLIDKQVEGYQGDTLRSESECAPLVAKCDSALTLYAAYADTLKKTIVTQSELLAIKDSAISTYQQKYTQLNASYNSAKTDISILKDELSSKTTWWKRNEKWIYFIGGILTIKLIAK